MPQDQATINALVQSIESAAHLGDIVDAIYGDDIQRAYVMENHQTVLFYNYATGYWRAERHKNIQDAYESAIEYGGE